MKPLNKKENRKYQRKNPTDKKLWLNLWKRMIGKITIYESAEENWDELYKKHLKR